MKPVALTVWMAAALAACTPATVVKYAPLRCPPVPECRRSEMPLTTNGELAAAYLQRDSELAQCKIARDSLQQCLDGAAP